MRAAAGCATSCCNDGALLRRPSHLRAARRRDTRAPLGRRAAPASALATRLPYGANAATLLAPGRCGALFAPGARFPRWSAKPTSRTCPPLDPAPRGGGGRSPRRRRHHRTRRRSSPKRASAIARAHAATSREHLHALCRSPYVVLHLAAPPSRGATAKARRNGTSTNIPIIHNELPKYWFFPIMIRNTWGCHYRACGELTRRPPPTKRCFCKSVRKRSRLQCRRYHWCNCGLGAQGFWTSQKKPVRHVCAGA